MLIKRQVMQTKANVPRIGECLCAFETRDDNKIISGTIQR